MFAIYSSSGRLFSGPLERLRRVEKSATIETSRKTAMAESELTGVELQAEVSPYQATQQATQQYIKLLHDEGQRDPVYHAHQIMTQSVQVLRSSWPVSKAIAAFQKHPYQLFPVVNEYDQLVGALSRQQLYEFILGTNVDHEQSIASCFLSEKSRVYSAEPITDIRRIATLLLEKKLDALPIADDAGRIVGLVSRTDILSCVIADPPLSLWC